MPLFMLMVVLALGATGAAVLPFRYFGGWVGIWRKGMKPQLSKFKTRRKAVKKRIFSESGPLAELG